VLNLPLNGLRSGEPIKGVIVRASESAGFKKVLSEVWFCLFFLVLLFDFDSQKE